MRAFERLMAAHHRIFEAIGLLLSGEQFHVFVRRYWRKFGPSMNEVGRPLQYCALTPWKPPKPRR